MIETNADNEVLQRGDKLPDSCPICLSMGVTFPFQTRDYIVGRCTPCGSAFVVPTGATRQRQAEAAQHSAAEQAALHRQAMARSYLYIQTVFLAQPVLWQRYWRERMDRIDAYCSAPGRLLDIGCGIGQFQREAEHRGWTTVGIEPSIPQSGFARDEWGLDVRTGFFEQMALPAASFDVVCAWSVIEHVQDPRHFLMEIGRVLRPGGLVALQTPNQESLLTTLVGLGYWLTRGRKLLPIYSLEHRYRFSRQGLTLLLEEEGFTTLNVEAYDNLEVMLARMALLPHRAARRAALTAIHGAATVTGRPNQLLAFARLRNAA